MFSITPARLRFIREALELNHDQFSARIFATSAHAAGLAQMEDGQRPISATIACAAEGLLRVHQATSAAAAPVAA